LTAQVRPAAPPDAAAIAAIYNQGIEDRTATFETAVHSGDDFAERLSPGGAPMLVAEVEGTVVGWAGIVPYSDRSFYAGVGEAMLYVERSARRGGVGTRLLDQLAVEAERHGYYKLIGKLFAANVESIALVRRCGFREVGVHLRHGRLDGEWRDVLVVERLLGEAA
jgi:L-amino acid N-acyltransferase YncA